ncbi:hypothetical protein F5Y17DRAFT_321157 [Xylariaceae sp. FL0594]|nr:hypothetical protein F5Y17DRAFT_321157 [Xylariaceae sp. FL0594]
MNLGANYLSASHNRKVATAYRGGTKSFSWSSRLICGIFLFAETEPSLMARSRPLRACWFFPLPKPSPHLLGRISCSFWKRQSDATRNTRGKSAPLYFCSRHVRFGQCLTDDEDNEASFVINNNIIMSLPTRPFVGRMLSNIGQHPWITNPTLLRISNLRSMFVTMMLLFVLVTLQLKIATAWRNMNKS